MSCKHRKAFKNFSKWHLFEKQARTTQILNISLPFIFRYICLIMLFFFFFFFVFDLFFFFFVSRLLVISVLCEILFSLQFLDSSFSFVAWFTFAYFIASNKQIFFSYFSCFGFRYCFATVFIVFGCRVLSCTIRRKRLIKI